MVSSRVRRHTEAGLQVTSTLTSVDRVLQLARQHLDMDVAWMSVFDAGSQRFEAVSARIPDARPSEGQQAPMHESFCVRVLAGQLPPVVPNALADPLTRDLAATSELNIGAYAGAPVRRADGSVRGMLCCTSVHPRAELAEKDLSLLELLARLLGELVEREGEQDGYEARNRRVRDAIKGDIRRIVYQPMVEIETSRAIGIEALSRFAGPGLEPARVFAEAADAGLLTDLEAAAACEAMQVLAEDPEVRLAVNLSPGTVTSGVLDELLVGVDLDRLTLELTEHAPVADYDELLAALAPHRARGLRIAVDDAGAGYASFRHILLLSPDLIKIDISLVQDVDTSEVKQTLVASLLTCARAAQAELLAEGVERRAEFETLARLGVQYVQGFLFGRPAEAPVPVGSVVPLVSA